MTYRYKLLKDILDYKADTVIWVDDKFGYLGKMPWGWEIPRSIIEAHPDWFEPVEGNK